MRNEYAEQPVETRATLMSVLDQLEGMLAMTEGNLHGNPPMAGTVSGATPMPSSLIEVARIRVSDAVDRLAKINEELRILS